MFIYFRRKPWKRAEIFKRKTYKAPNLKNLNNRYNIKFKKLKVTAIFINQTINNFKTIPEQ